MSICRVDSMCKKYDKYDIEKQCNLNLYGNDAFPRLCARVNYKILSRSSEFYLKNPSRKILFNVNSKEPEGTGACRRELEVVEFQNVDNTASVSENNKTVVERYPDSQLRNEFQGHCQGFL
ncbi:hypothetical protein Pyn_25576 [Prunus yedoensis var. nudiflora]|uniref:Uncharacterized protein n=1 Tax=Prunus yedoensis var. nudiflora TaxID=2094558 RepID=A0A314V0C5_PRUYE|nr:hypothetical protein Pyn_25576 [Prunus yedoensis var. nudiflora]